MAAEVAVGTSTSVDALEVRRAADVFLLGCGVRRQQARALMHATQVAMAQIGALGGKGDGLSQLIETITGLAGGKPEPTAQEREQMQRELEAMRQIDEEVAAQAAWMADPARLHQVWSEYGGAIKGFRPNG